MKEKICPDTGRKFIPTFTFQVGGLRTGSKSLDNIFLPDDKEAGQSVCREGFFVVVSVIYDGMGEMSKNGLTEVSEKIPFADEMEVLRLRV